MSLSGVCGRRGVGGSWRLIGVVDRVVGVNVGKGGRERCERRERDVGQVDAIGGLGYGSSAG